MTREYYHSKEYVIKYIRRHLQKGHSLQHILDHIRPHVTNDVLYEVMQEMSLDELASAKPAEHVIEEKQNNTAQNTSTAQPKDEGIDPEDPQHYKVDETSLLKQFRLYEFLIILLLLVLFFYSFYSTVYASMLFMLALLWIGLAWSGAFRAAQRGLLLSAVGGAILIAPFDGVQSAGFYLGIVLLLSFVLYLSKKHPKDGLK